MLLTLAGAFFISLIACFILVRVGGIGRMLDQPNARSLHAIPVPRIGGVAIGLGMAPVMLLFFLGGESHVRFLIAGWVLVFAVSLLDDIYDLPAWQRLTVHLAAGALVVFSPTYPDTPLSIAAGLLWIAWGTNLFNFMDGIDGLAGTMAVIGGGVMGVAFFTTGHIPVALLLAAAVAAVAGFLVFNLPPARIFMGDAGSAPLGFLFAATAVSGTGVGYLPPWLPLLVFLPFIADATFTLLRRVAAREPFWRAHRSHAYQRIVLSGWPVSRILFAEFGVMLVCGGVALSLPWNGVLGWRVLLAVTVLSAVAYWRIMRISYPKGN